MDAPSIEDHRPVGNHEVFEPKASRDPRRIAEWATRRVGGSLLRLPALECRSFRSALARALPLRTHSRLPEAEHTHCPHCFARSLKALLRPPKGGAALSL
jgi:hypothetical protein